MGFKLNQKKLSFWLVIACFQFFAQTVNSKRHLSKHLKEGQYYFDYEDYYNSWRHYRKALTINSKHEKAGVNAAICTVKLNFISDSLTLLENNLETSKLPDAAYFLAKIRHKEKRFEEAIGLLEAFIRVSSKNKLHSDNDAYHLLQTCKNAMQFIAIPRASIITNAGDKINSTYDDYAPVIMPDKSALYFTSKREKVSGIKKTVSNSVSEDIYVSYRSQNDWKVAENIGFPINTETNDACVAISSDGKKMIIYRSAADNKSGDLYLTRLGSNGRWSVPKIMSSEINSAYIESSACFSNDTTEIYFSSNRPGGYGGKDIYRIKKLPNGAWSNPYNLGSEINTEHDEDAPFLHNDGITLYFSSKGHNSMGEYDVFKSVLDPSKNKFSKPENLGYPINDVDNDIFFVLSIDGHKGYYSSAKKDSYGGTDIYEIDTRFNDQDILIQRGYIYSANQPISAKISLVEKNEIRGIYFSDDQSGKFILMLNPLKTYTVLVEEDGYEVYQEEIGPMASEKTEHILRFNLNKNDGN
jgi:tetratricopeptide (TPR) repeat protein